MQKFVGLGAKFSGPCLGCKAPTGARPFELADTLLYRDSSGKFAVAHAQCAGVKIRSRVNGQKSITGTPKSFG